MVDRLALDNALREYTRGLLRSYDIGKTLYWLTDQVPLVVDVDGAGVFLGVEEAQLDLVTATDAKVTRIDAVQMEVGNGPCLDAYRRGEQVLSEDLTTETRWPAAYLETAATAGFGAVAGLPMPVDDRPIGALNLYRNTPSPWSSEELEAAQLLADMATGYVVNVRNLDASATLSNQLSHALDSRVIIEQAKGVLAGRHGMDVDDAFDLLRRYARRERRSLHDLCREVVDGSLEL